MKKAWLVIVGIILVAGLMLLLTLRIPEIKALALSIAASKHLPLWIVGLFSPIIYVFQRIGDWVKSFNTQGNGVIAKNQQIEAEQQRIRRELDSLLDWRSRMLQQEYEAVSRLKTDISRMETQLASLGSQIRTVQNTPVEEIAASMSEQEKDDVFERYFKEHGATIYK